MLDPELSGGLGTFRGCAYRPGVRCLGFWFSIGVCGIYLVFLLQAALGGVLFTTTFTGNNIGVFAVSRLACYFLIFF